MIYWRWFLGFVLGLGLSFGSSPMLRAASSDVDVKALVNQIDTAANEHSLEKLMSLYSAEFVTTDGLKKDALAKALQQMWQRYPDLKYTTEIQSSEKKENTWVAETLTTIEGTSNNDLRDIQLKAEIKSRQTFQDGQLIRQEILTERTELTSGTNPPQVKVNLPEQVRLGEEFDFDVIVQEPISDDLLAGTAIGEKVEGDRYLDPAEMELQLLQSGGLFKRIKAEGDPENHWFSAILIRSEGITLITQRVRFVP